MDPRRFREPLGWDRCEECGECLVRCRYLDLSRGGAIDVIRAVNRGDRPAPAALEACAGCGACNTFCPHESHPYERIHYPWHHRIAARGIPRHASYLLPTAASNFRTRLPYSRARRALLDRWDTPDPPAATVLYPGCNLRVFPELATGRLFDGLPVWGGWGQCCGEMIYRLGALDEVAASGARLAAFYNGRGLREMVFVCPACYAMFGRILPEQFGVRFDFRVTFVDRWIERREARGELTIEPRVEGDVVVHDSCQGRLLGAEFMDRQRALLRRCGLTVHETAPCREEGLCCGVAAGAQHFRLADVSRSALRAWGALASAAGDAVASYCLGCVLTLSCTRLLSPHRKPVRHTLEFLHEAIGDPHPLDAPRRAAQVLAGVSLRAAPFLASRRRVRLDGSPLE